MMGYLPLHDGPPWRGRGAYAIIRRVGLPCMFASDWCSICYMPTLCCFLPWLLLLLSLLLLGYLLHDYHLLLPFLALLLSRSILLARLLLLLLIALLLSPLLCPGDVHSIFHPFPV